MIRGKSERITSPGRVLVVANHVKDPCIILYPKRVSDAEGRTTLNPTEARQLMADIEQALRLMDEYPN